VNDALLVGGLDAFGNAAADFQGFITGEGTRGQPMRRRFALLALQNRGILQAPSGGRGLLHALDNEERRALPLGIVRVASSVTDDVGGDDTQKPGAVRRRNLANQRPLPG
jgi:hypothetical protein